MAMMSGSVRFLHRLAVVTALCGTFMILAAGAADARVFVGVGIGVPFYGPGYYGPPPYYPPPVYYAPPPVYYPPPPPVVYSPPQTYAPPPVAAGQSCYAGPYVCPMDRPVPSGASCYCLGNGGQRIPGRAN